MRKLFSALVSLMLLPGALSACARAATATASAGPASSASFAADVPVNVRSRGAKGDGATDDTAAFASAVEDCNAAGGCIFYVPRGKYRTSGGFVFNVPVILRGDGATNGSISATYLSRVECSSPTAVLFTLQGLNWKVEDILLVNTSARAPTAGSAILATHPSANYARGVYENVWVEGFYDGIDAQVGGNWSMHATVVQDPVRYGLRIRNTLNLDTGDWAISNSTFVASSRLADSAVRIESSGGGKIVNLKVNGVSGNGTAPSFNYGVNIDASRNGGNSGTGITLITNSSIENVRGQGVRIVGHPSGFPYVTLSNLEIALYGVKSASGYAIYLENVHDSIVDNIVAVGDGAGPPAVLLKNCARIKTGTIHATGFNPYVFYDTAYSESGYTHNNGWNSVNFQNGWANLDGPAACQYRMDGGAVWVKCAARGGAVGSVMFTLPLGYRPTGKFFAATYEGGAARFVSVDSSGEVKHEGTANASVIFYFSFLPR